MHTYALGVLLTLEPFQRQFLDGDEAPADRPGQGGHDGQQVDTVTALDRRVAAFADEPPRVRTCVPSRRVEHAMLDGGDQPRDDSCAGRKEARPHTRVCGRFADGADAVQRRDPLPGVRAVRHAAGDGLAERLSGSAPSAIAARASARPRGPLERRRSTEVLEGELDAVVLVDGAHALERPVQVRLGRRAEVAGQEAGRGDGVQPDAPVELRHLERDCVPRVMERAQPHGLAAERLDRVPAVIGDDARVGGPARRLEAEPAAALPRRDDRSVGSPALHAQDGRRR